MDLYISKVFECVTEVVMICDSFEACDGFILKQMNTEVAVQQIIN
jgi:hypothetical protein